MIRREENYGMRSGKSRTLFGILAVAIAGLLVIALPGVAAARDRNHDRIPDRWEKRHHLSLHKNQARRDQDRDGLKNRQEWKAGDDPRDPDSDNDGAEDGDEGAGHDRIVHRPRADDRPLQRRLDQRPGHRGHRDQVRPAAMTRETRTATARAATTAIQARATTGEQGDDVGDDNQGEDVGDDQSGDSQKVHAKSASDDEPGDDAGDDQGDEDNDDQGDDNHTCSVDNLVRGAVVQEAELELEHGQADVRGGRALQVGVEARGSNLK